MTEEQLASKLYEKFKDEDYVGRLIPDVPLVVDIVYRGSNDGNTYKIIGKYKNRWISAKVNPENYDDILRNNSEFNSFTWVVEKNTDSKCKILFHPGISKKFEDLSDEEKHYWLEHAREIFEDWDK